MDFNWWPHMFGFWIFPLLCALFMIAMMSFGHGRDSREDGTARDILQRRYASGEIGKAEYDALRRDIET
jgi:uncharacterized membrane protein